MSHRSPARWLAPAALIASLVVVFAIFSGTTGDEEPAGSPGRGATATSTTEGGGETAERRSGGETRGAGTSGGSRGGEDGGSGDQRTYTVKPGDSFSTIAEQTGVSVERLRELNPDLDPQALDVGDEVRLEP